MAPLPSRPTFPVFGLGEQFDGFRWLTLWNDRTDLYTVTLGHGRPEDRAYVSVETVNKTPRVWTSPHSAKGPTGFTDAVLAAASGLSRFTHNRPAEEAAMMERGLSEMDWHDDDDGVDLPDSWVPETILIDGVVRAAHSRRLDKAWATVVDLTTVAVAIVGPAAMSHLGHELSDMSSKLDQYVT